MWKAESVFIVESINFIVKPISMLNLYIVQYYSISKLKRDLDILYYFTLELSANKTASLLVLTMKLCILATLFSGEKLLTAWTATSVS